MRPQGARRRARPVLCGAQESPYEPLEKAVRVINRVIALGEKSSWGADEAGPAGGGGGSSDGPPAAQKERWVQFGAMYNSRVTVEEPLHAAGQRGTQPAAPAQQAAAAAAGSGQRGRQLRDYLALPIEDYSLLDPKWISREEGGLFRFCLPLQDLVNVELQPEIYFSVAPEPQQRRVTLAGTRAALGSPELDQAFKLNVTAVISQRQLRRLPVPDHLPGRPVFRLRRWAAAARGRTWPRPEGSAAAPASGAASPPAAAAAATAAALEAGAPLPPQAASVAAAAAATASSAPFPDQRVYISHDENDEDEYALGAAELAASELAVADLALAELEEAEEALPGSSDGRDSSSGGGSDSYTSTPPPDAASAGAGVLPSGADGSSAGEARRPALLHCRAHVTMAVRVPAALKVVPNPLLGYAGSLLLRAVLSATLPSFLELLAADYRRWAGLDAGAASRQLDTPVGELFSDAAAAVREGRERRQQQQQHVEGGAPRAGEQGRPEREREPAP